jgi:hypothetical protein
MNLPASIASPTELMTGDEMRRYAAELARSSMVSPYFRGSTANMLYAIELGRVYGMEPATILQNIHVFEGADKSGNTVLKAGLSAALMVTLARRAGHIVKTSANPIKATCTIVRGDTILGKILKGRIPPEELSHYRDMLITLKDMGVDPKESMTTEVVWNEDKAKRAGLFGKGNWVKYPQSMYPARAKSEGIRLACEEVLIQLADRASQVGELTAAGQPIAIDFTHTADELGAPMTDEGETVRVEHDTPRRASARRASKVRTEHEEDAEKIAREGTAEEILLYATKVREDDLSEMEKLKILAHLRKTSNHHEKGIEEVEHNKVNTTLEEAITEIAREVKSAA